MCVGRRNRQIRFVKAEAYSGGEVVRHPAKELIPGFQENLLSQEKCVRTANRLWWAGREYQGA